MIVKFKSNKTLSDWETRALKEEFRDIAFAYNLEWVVILK
jgi:hypothetical protein